jgi:LacI family transcriptional regulator
MNVLLANADLEAERQVTYLNLFEQERVGGLLVAPVPGTDEGLRSLAARRNVVALNHCPGPDMCCVTVDNELGGYLAARHLIETGRRRLLFPTGPDLEPLVLRQRGVERAVAEANGAVQLSVMAVDEVQVEHGRKVGHHLAGMPPDERPDGIVAPADLLALGVEQALLTESDCRIPDDVSLIGYDNNRAAWDSLVPISTIGQPGELMGRVATQLLLEEVSGEPHEHQHVVLEPELIVKASSTRP